MGFASNTITGISTFIQQNWNAADAAVTNFVSTKYQNSPAIVQSSCAVLADYGSSFASWTGSQFSKITSDRVATFCSDNQPTIKTTATVIAKIAAVVVVAMGVFKAANALVTLAGKGYTEASARFTTWRHGDVAARLETAETRAEELEGELRAARLKQEGAEGVALRMLGVEDEIKGLQGEVTRLTKASEALQKEVDARGDQIRAKQDELDRTKELLAEEEKKVQDAGLLRDEAAGKIRELEKAVLEQGEALVVARKDLVAAQTKAGEAESARDEALRNLKDVTSHLELANGQIREIGKEFQGVSDELAQAKKELDTTTADLTKRAEGAEAKEAALGKALAEARQANEEQDKTISSLKEEVKRLKGEVITERALKEAHAIKLEEANRSLPSVAVKVEAGEKEEGSGE